MGWAGRGRAQPGSSCPRERSGGADPGPDPGAGPARSCPGLFFILGARRRCQCQQPASKEGRRPSDPNPGGAPGPAPGVSGDAPGMAGDAHLDHEAVLLAIVGHEDDVAVGGPDEARQAQRAVRAGGRRLHRGHLERLHAAQLGGRVQHANAAQQGGVHLWGHCLSLAPGGDPPSSHSPPGARLRNHERG